MRFLSVVLGYWYWLAGTIVFQLVVIAAWSLFEDYLDQLGRDWIAGRWWFSWVPRLLKPRMAWMHRFVRHPLAPAMTTLAIVVVVVAYREMPPAKQDPIEVRIVSGDTAVAPVGSPSPTTSQLGVSMDIVRADATDAMSCADLTARFRGTLLLIVARVRNTGPPSIVDYGPVVVTFPTGETVTAMKQRVPKGFYFQNGRTGQTVGYSGEDALYDVTGQHPLATGAGVAGILLYAIKDVDYEAMLAPGTRYCIDYRDVFEHKKTACLTASTKHPDEDAVTSQIPGLHPPPPLPTP